MFIRAAIQITCVVMTIAVIVLAMFASDAVERNGDYDLAFRLHRMQGAMLLVILVGNLLL